MKKIKGFTLVELMIALAVTGILAAIAVPSYYHFIKSSRLQAAQTDLVNMSVSMENYYYQQLSYPESTTTTTQSQTELKGWVPTQKKYFDYTILRNGNNYTLSATGISTENMANYNVSLTNENIREVNENGNIKTW